jgi:hypothetical protein
MKKTRAIKQSIFLDIYEKNLDFLVPEKIVWTEFVELQQMTGPAAANFIKLFVP